MTDPKWYFGNYPNSREYNDNIPIGWNKWDAEDCYDGADEIETDWEEENEAEEREEEQ